MHMQTRMLLYFIVLLITINSVLAVQYDTFTTEAVIEDETVHFQIEATATFNNEPLTLDLPATIDKETLQVYIDDFTTDCSQAELVGKTQVTCDTVDGPHIITVTFDSTYPLIVLQDQLLFQFEQAVNATDYRFILKLPVGYIIEDTRFVTPQADDIYSDGQRIILSWNEKPLAEPFEVSIVSHGMQRTNWLLYIIILILVGIIVGYILWQRKPRKKKEEAEDKSIILSNMLLENERKVIAVLKEAENHQLWQKQLEIRTGLPKVKLSRLIKSLETRGLIKKEPFGASNIITLLEKKEQPKETPQ